MSSVPLGDQWNLLLVQKAMKARAIQEYGTEEFESKRFTQIENDFEAVMNTIKSESSFLGEDYDQQLKEAQDKFSELYIGEITLLRKEKSTQNESKSLQVSSDSGGRKQSLFRGPQRVEYEEVTTYDPRKEMYSSLTQPVTTTGLHPAEYAKMSLEKEGFTPSIDITTEVGAKTLLSALQGYNHKQGNLQQLSVCLYFTRQQIRYFALAWKPKTSPNTWEVLEWIEFLQVCIFGYPEVEDVKIMVIEEVKRLSTSMNDSRSYEANNKENLVLFLRSLPRRALDEIDTEKDKAREARKAIIRAIHKEFEWTGAQMLLEKSISKKQALEDTMLLRDIAVKLHEVLHEISNPEPVKVYSPLGVGNPVREGNNTSIPTGIVYRNISTVEAAAFEKEIGKAKIDLLMGLIRDRKCVKCQSADHQKDGCPVLPKDRRGLTDNEIYKGMKIYQYRRALRQGGDGSAITPQVCVDANEKLEVTGTDNELRKFMEESRAEMTKVMQEIDNRFREDFEKFKNIVIPEKSLVLVASDLYSKSTIKPAFTLRHDKMCLVLRRNNAFSYVLEELSTGFITTEHATRLYVFKESINNQPVPIIPKIMDFANYLICYRYGIEKIISFHLKDEKTLYVNIKTMKAEKRSLLGTNLIGSLGRLLFVQLENWVKTTDNDDAFKFQEAAQIMKKKLKKLINRQRENCLGIALSSEEESEKKMDFSFSKQWASCYEKGS